jgi:hypothetical protein
MEEITHMAEKHQLLLATHFRGRPGRTTTDLLHLPTDTIKVAWHRKQVVSVLFLDIKGVFPNAVTKRLLHNMRRRRIPEEYVKFVENMLTDRKMKLKFDDFMSEWFILDNGIGQGDPLSMILYLFYNADLLKIAKGSDEKELGYANDNAMITIAKTFRKMHAILRSMMTWRGGGITWSKSHNSSFETLKSILVDFIHSKTVDRPPLVLQGITITPQEAHKFIGIILDQELHWNQQADYAIAKAAKWTLAFRRLARPAAGIRPKLMRQLYNSVTMPKMTYTADVWYTPIYKLKGRKKSSSSIHVTRK